MSQLHNWFETKVQYEKMSPEDGLQRKATEVYLIDALSFTEAEARAIYHAQPYTSGKLTVASIKRTKFYEVFDAATGDKWFKAKVLFIVLDQEKGTEKRVASYMLIQAEDIKEARERLEEGMKGTMSDYEVAKIEETPIMDVIPYLAEEEKEVGDE